MPRLVCDQADTTNWSGSDAVADKQHALNHVLPP